MANGSMVPKLAGTFLGMVSGAILIGGGQAITHRIFPPPAGLEPTDSAGLAAHVASLPTSAFLGILLTYLLGSLVGGTAAGMASKGSLVPVVLTGIMLLFMGVLNTMTIPHPFWFNVSMPIVFITGTVIARKISRSSN